MFTTLTFFLIVTLRVLGVIADGLWERFQRP
jgi:hypothetical protein